MTMASSNAAARGPKVPIFLTAGFRFFFLAAGLYAILAMAAWLSWLGIHAAGGAVVTPTMAMAPHFWHAHEMIMGFAVAVISGFFLTAVPNWTNTAPARAAFVSSVGGLWLAGRLAMWFSAFLPAFLVAVVDLAFLPALTVRLAINMRNNPQPRNVVVVGLLGIVTIGNLMMHLEWTGITDDTAASGARLALFTIGGLIAVIGGRVTPSFTRNALRRVSVTADPVDRPIFDRAGVFAAGAVGPLVALGVPDMAVGVVAIVAGLANGARLAGWQGRHTLKEPILWSLHLGFLMVAVGFLYYGVALLLPGLGEIAALHLIAIGAVGCMTMAMMTRAALGHTGRGLKVAPAIAVAYLLVAAAALTRTFGLVLFPAGYYQVVFLSGALWMAGFAIFSVIYFPILTGPRPGLPTG
ncbi:MAG TPA: NnrS family protein [Kaistiaceae bacterium]|nr:NnrS family protein [Kaistiaceae bacterium]